MEIHGIPKELLDYLPVVLLAFLKDKEKLVVRSGLEYTWDQLKRLCETICAPPNRRPAGEPPPTLDAALEDPKTRAMLIEQLRAKVDRDPTFRAQLGDLLAGTQLFDRTAPIASRVTFLHRETGTVRTALFLAPPRERRMFGRDALLKKLKSRILEPRNPGVFAIHGVAGVGKTAIALELAHDPDLLQRFPGGILWAGLGPPSRTRMSPGDTNRELHLLNCLRQWATALGSDESELAAATTLPSYTNLVRRKLAGDAYFIVVDDAWSLEEAEVLHVGDHNDGHLITTRSPKIAMEFEGRASPRVPSLSATSSLDLLREIAPRAVRVAPDKCRALARSVGCLPLAITLLGRRLMLAGECGGRDRVHETVDLLTHTIDRLAESPLPGANPPAPQTSRSLDAAVRLSDEALDVADRTALYMLSAFPAKPNSFSANAAVAVTSADKQVIYRLADYGLLEPVGNRYTIHQVIARYAAARLAESPDHLVRARQAMARHFADFASRHAADFGRMYREHANIVAALAACRDAGLTEDFVRTCNALFRFVEASGLYRLDAVRNFLALAAEAATGLAARAATPDEAKRYSAYLTTALLNQARVAEKRGEIGLAESLLDRAFAIAATSDDAKRLSGLHVTRAVIRHNQCRYDDALKHLNAALEFALRTGEPADPSRLSHIYRRLADVAIAQGDFAEARSHASRSRNLVDKDSADDYGAVLLRLGVISFCQGHLGEALGNLDRALALANECELSERVCAVLHIRGAVAHNMNRFEEAEGNLKTALHLARRLEHPWYLSAVRNEMAELHLRRGNFERAHKASQEALRIASIRGFPDRSAFALFTLARTAAAEARQTTCPQRMEEALDYAARSLDIFRGIRHHHARTLENWIAENRPSAAPLDHAEVHPPS